MTSAFAGSEFVTPAVSSPSQFTTRPDEADAARETRLAASPHIKFLDQVHCGYFILDVRPARAQADWYFVETITERSNAQRFVAGYSTRSGDNALTKADGPVASRRRATALTRHA